MHRQAGQAAVDMAALFTVRKVRVEGRHSGDAGGKEDRAGIANLQERMTEGQR